MKHLFPLLTALSTHLLRRPDIDVLPFRALVRTYLTMDLRNQHFGHATGTSAKDMIAPLFWVIGQYLLMSGIVSALLFARVEAFFFALAGLTVSMVLMATAIIVEFNEVVLDPSDLEVIAHRPVALRTYAAARLTNLLVYVLLVTAALNVFPAIVGAGLRDAGWLFLPLDADRAHHDRRLWRPGHAARCQRHPGNAGVSPAAVAHAPAPSLAGDLCGRLGG
jgi:hypothetical protein